MKQEAMYVLRKSIGAFDTLEAGYEAVKKKLKEKLETYPASLEDEALLARDQNRGMSLLSFAAQTGNKDWFHHILRRIRQKVRVRKFREGSLINVRHKLFLWACINNSFLLAYFQTPRLQARLRFNDTVRAAAVKLYGRLTGNVLVGSGAM